MSTPSEVLAKVGEALEAMLSDIQDEHEAHEAEDEGFIVAAHMPYGDVLRARAALTELRALRVVEGWAAKDEWWSARGMETWEFCEDDGSITPEGKSVALPATLLLPASLKEDET